LEGTLLGAVPNRNSVDRLSQPIVIAFERWAEIRCELCEFCGLCVTVV
jgi:hypothetical protein